MLINTVFQHLQLKEPKSLNYIYYYRDLGGGEKQFNEHEWNKGSLFKTSYLKKVFLLRSYSIESVSERSICKIN